MKAALLIVLSLSALAFAGPAFNKNNQIDSQESYTNKQQQQQQQNAYFNTRASSATAKGPVVDILKQWCSSSQMSQQELTASFKKLVGVVKSNPNDQTTQQAVMNERICSGVNSGKQQQQQQQQQQKDETTGKQTGSDAQAHELIKDVYMDALIACKSRDCTQQLLNIIQQQSDKVDNIRASYYMTRLAVTEKDQIKSAEEIKQLVESFIQQRPSEQTSESVERQKLFAVTSMVGKYCQNKPEDSQAKQIAQDVAKTIVERYLRPVSQQEIQQYTQQDQDSQQKMTSEQSINKIAKRNAALKALANLPGHVLKEVPECDEQLMTISQNKQELVSSRQSAIECLEQNDKAQQMLKEIAFDQEEPIEVRIAAYRTLMTVAYSTDSNKDEQQKSQIASQIIDQLVKYCENSRNQQQDDQFVLYVISHLDNIRSSQQPEHQAIKECMMKNKQHYMQIQVLCKKFQKQLSDVRSSSRNYKLEQEFNQIESGLILEGDLIYESKNKQQQKQQLDILPKLIRVNMSMPVMGETVNVVEVTLRQSQMDEEILSALKLVQSTKFSSESVSKVVDSFKSSVEKQQQQQKYNSNNNENNNNNQQGCTEADLTIKVDGCTVVYLTMDDFKTSTTKSGRYQQHQRNTRSVSYSGSPLVDDIIEYLKRSPVSFNRGINFNVNERIAKLLDVEANLIAGLRFESRAQGHSSDNFELVAQVEPRFNFEAIVGPAKMSSKKLLQRLSTKTAMGLRLRFKRDELVDVQIDLPMKTMELFTVESQIVEKTNSNSYNYLPESIYGQEDIYNVQSLVYPSEMDGAKYLAKRSIFDKNSKRSMITNLIKGNKVQHTFETSKKFARTTGLNAKLNVVAAPKDMSFIVSCVVDKYEPSMEGYRVQIQKSTTSSATKTYIVQVSTPGSRTDRQAQLTLVKQFTSQRTVLKSDIQMSNKLAATLFTEIVHDGRQYSIKSEIVSRSPRSQWRHSADCGVMIVGASKSPVSGRLAQVAYKPYIQIESTSLKRPLQLQGTIAYSQSPKSVISYELKCPTSGDYIQGKLIVDQRDVKSSSAAAYRSRRSMQSPLEIALTKDITLTNELVAQVNSHAIKVHNMLDWDAQKFALQKDLSATYKNMRKSTTGTTVSVKCNLDAEQQLVVVERKCPEEQAKEFRAIVKSEWRAPSSHQMLAEIRYGNDQQRQMGQQQQAYKHKIELNQIGHKQYDCQMQVEIVDTERQVNEKFVGRSRLSTGRAQKSIQIDLSNVRRQQVAKVSFDYQSLAQHQLEVLVQGQEFLHKCEIRNNQRQFVIVSRTDKRGQTWAKLLVDMDKSEDKKDCKIVFECPIERVSVAADLKLTSGQRSSLAVQTPRFVSQGEFSFETVARPFLSGTSKFLPIGSLFSSKKSANLRFRNHVKDLQSKEAYWMESALNAANWDKEGSYLRFESPVYRTDLEFDPRQQTTKFATFARSKRSINEFDSIYSDKNSALNNFFESHQTIGELAKQLNQVGQPNKMWMLRAIMSSPFARDQLKQQARRALLQYVDRDQVHSHSVKYQPEESSVDFDFNLSPNGQQSSTTFEPLRFKGQVSDERPINMSFDSEWMSADVEAKPFDDEDCYARISALSRHRRSPFKSHESEWRYKKDQGHKAYMKHQDSKGKRHEFRAETEQDPKKHTKMSFESEKHGKANWEHKWRKHAEKRSANKDQEQQEVYANQMQFRAEGPAHNQWMHQTDFQWEEPIEMVRRHRRSILDTDYSPAEYLKHTSARLSSSQYAMRPINGQTEQPLYKVDFDYKPQLNSARLDLQMPEDMLHQSSIEMKPEERLYKVQSKLFNKRNQDSVYDFSASTKPYVASLATANQEPVFVHSQHQMLERPIDTSSMVYQLFKQPMKLEYNDKYGRSASFDYDQLPIASERYAGLRQKRAAVFYKDSDKDFEHSSSFDFYPETFLGRMKQTHNTGFSTTGRKPMIMDDVVIKTQTKYGPLVVRVDTSDKENMQCELESPIVNAKLSAETGANMRGLIKMHLDNKSQSVQLSKMLRKAPETVRNCELANKIARKIDSTRFEHDTELLISLVDSIFKINSQTQANSRKVLTIEGEYNEKEGKAYAKINGERVNGQCVVDLMRKSADLVVDATTKRGEPIRHTTRLVRTSEQFYTLESTTTIESRPVLKLVGKVSALIFEEPSHFASRRHTSHQGHISTFEAFVYEPKKYHVTGLYDCEKKEARVVCNCEEENKVQETVVKYDDNKDAILVNSRLVSAQEGQVYSAKAKIDLTGLFESSDNKCSRGNDNCSSEAIYEDKSGVWATKYQPNQYLAVSTPRGKQTLKLNY